MRPAFSASARLQIIGKLIPSAPISIGAFANHGSLAAIRAKGMHGVPEVAVIIPCAEVRSIGPCSRSTMIQSSPERAMICTVWMLGMVAIAPNVGRPSCHNLRRRLRGAGAADVKSEAPFWGLRKARSLEKLAARREADKITMHSNYAGTRTAN